MTKFIVSGDQLNVSETVKINMNVGAHQRNWGR